MKLARAAVRAEAAKPAPAPQSESAEPAKPAKKSAKPPPWVTTPPLTPEAKREKARLKRKRNEAKHKLLRPEILPVVDGIEPAFDRYLEKLAERWPAAFPTDPSKIRPFAIGVHREIEKEITSYSKRALRVAVRKIANSEAYLAAVADGGKRYDLDGPACWLPEPPSPFVQVDKPARSTQA